MRRLVRSTSVRLAIGYTTLFAVSSLALAGFIWWATRDYLRREIDAIIQAEANALLDRFYVSGSSELVSAISNRIAETHDKQDVYLFVDPDFKRIAGNLDAWPLMIGRNPGWYETGIVGGDTVRTTRIAHLWLPGGYHLLIGRDIEDRARVEAVIVEALLWSLAVTATLALAVGFVFRRLLLARIQAISRTASAIVQGNLGERVPTSGADDEFDLLARSINAMLGQIERLIEGVSNVSNAIAHDLRTPLAELRTRLEGLVRTRPSAPAVYHEIETAIEDVDRLMAMFNALLRIANVGSGARKAAFRAVELAPIVSDVVDIYMPVADGKAVSLSSDLAGGLTVEGDRDLLAQAVGNVLDNAIKHAPPGSTVSIRLDRTQDRHAEIVISDSGPGIPDSERDNVIKPFYRIEKSRGSPGTGLGLSLVAVIAKLHDADLILANNRPGLRVTLAFPPPLQ